MIRAMNLFAAVLFLIISAAPSVSAADRDVAVSKPQGYRVKAVRVHQVTRGAYYQACQPRPSRAYSDWFGNVYYEPRRVFYGAIDTLCNRIPTY